ncbi:MAG: GSU2403 family nucleotidyltransferase fold protein [Rhizobiaceae bacterium]
MQLYESLQELKHRERSSRGSLVWMRAKGREYLHRSSYDDYGKRVQTTLGARSPETEKIREKFNAARDDVRRRVKTIDSKMALQAATNVARGIARLPLRSARIVRAFENVGISSERLKVVGTHALFAFEAMAGSMFDSRLTSTEDLDFLIDPRAPLRFIANDELPSETLLGVLQSADRSFELTRQPFRARNRDGFLVDIIKPERSPPWKNEAFEAGHDDLQPSPINGLVWLENAPAIEQRVLDTSGFPLTMHVPDPRVFAIHKYWLSSQPNRDPLKSRRDKAQAFAVANLVITELKHLPFDGRSLRMLPREIVSEAIAAFKADSIKQAALRED